jgi:succinate-semialdehyde dehydrogenase
MGDPRDEQTILGRWRVSICAMSCISRSRRPWLKGRPCCWGGENRRAGQLLCANGAGQRDPGDDRIPPGAVWPGGDHYRGTRRHHALALANDSEFGLSATVFTASVDEAQRFSRELECGGVFINGYCASDARVAFGGVKKSGFGRELSHFGLHEFCNADRLERPSLTEDAPDDRRRALLYSQPEF